MAIHKFEVNGKVERLEAPDDMPVEEVQRQAQQYFAQQQEATPAPEAPEESIVPEDTWGSAFRGLADTAATVVSGAGAEVAAGITGLGYLAAGRGNERAAQAMDTVRQTLTHSAWSKAGKYNEEQIGKIAEKVVPILDKVDQIIGDYATNPETGELHPMAATAVKTAVYGLPSILGVKGTNLQGLRGMSIPQRMAARYKAKSDLTREMAKAKADASRLGIVTTNDELAPSTVALAESLAPQRKAAAGMGEVQRHMMDAEAAAKDIVDAAYKEARAKRAYVDVPAMQAVAAQAQRKLLEAGTDIGQHPIVLRRLEQIRNLDRVLPGTPQELAGVRSPFQIKRAGLNNIEIMDKRLTADLAGAKRGEFTAEQQALYTIRKELRSKLDEEFDNAAITGDPAAHQAWQDAKAAHALYKKNFRTDRIIKKMVLNEATPEIMKNWIMGASANGLKKEAALTINRMKAILGEDHPAMETMRAALLRDTLSPILGEKPNFKAGVKNIDRLIKDNYSVMQALDINEKDLITLKQAAHAAEFARPIGPKWDKGFFTKAASRLVLGHKIAKAGLHVQIGHRILDTLFDTGALTEKAIVKHLAELEYNKPMVSFNDPKWKEIMVYGAAADVANMEE